MTRQKTEERLTACKEEEKTVDRQSFRALSLIYEIALLEAALKHGVDPDSVWFHHDINAGKGIKW